MVSAKNLVGLPTSMEFHGNLISNKVTLSTFRQNRITSELLRAPLCTPQLRGYFTTKALRAQSYTNLPAGQAGIYHYVKIGLYKRTAVPNYKKIAEQKFLFCFVVDYFFTIKPTGSLLLFQEFFDQ